MHNAYSVKQLSHAFQNADVLHNVTFTIATGDFFIIIGPNGSGKTTLMRLMAGLEPCRRGEIRLQDRPLGAYARKALAQTIAFVPQVIPADFPFRVSETVLLGRAPYLGVLGLDKPQDRDIARRAMAFTGIAALGRRRLAQLSGGERQRVFIARAIAQEPDIILLDEPTASLDLAHQIRIMDLMEQLKTEKRTTVVMVSHDINLAAMYADHLLLLKQGRILSQGSPAQVCTYQTLEAAYGCTLLVDESPLGRFPRITLVPKKCRQVESGINPVGG